MLELAAVLALSQACAPSVAPETLAAIAHVESRFDPLAIGVNRGGIAPARARDASEAASRSALKVESSPYAEPLTIISTFMLPSCLVASAARA